MSISSGHLRGRIRGQVTRMSHGVRGPAKGFIPHGMMLSHVSLRSSLMRSVHLSEIQTLFCAGKPATTNEGIGAHLQGEGF